MRAPGAVVQPDHRDARRGRQVHHLVDLLGEDLAQGAAEDGEVLAEDADPAAVDRAETGDDAVGVGAVLLQAHAVGPVAGQHVELLERPLVQEVLDALPGGQLALGVVALDGTRAAGVQGLVLAFGQVGQAFGHGMFHGGEANAPSPDPEIAAASPRAEIVLGPRRTKAQARHRGQGPAGRARREGWVPPEPVRPEPGRRAAKSPAARRNRPAGDGAAGARAIVEPPGDRYNSDLPCAGFGPARNAPTWSYIFAIER